MIIEITTPEGVKVKLEDANVDEIIKVAGKIIHMEAPGIIITGDGSGVKISKDEVDISGLKCSEMSGDYQNISESQSK